MCLYNCKLNNKNKLKYIKKTSIKTTYKQYVSVEPRSLQQTSFTLEVQDHYMLQEVSQEYWQALWPEHLLLVVFGG